MQCPKCGHEIPEGTLYCEKCGEEILIVPEYDPSTDFQLDSALQEIGKQVEKQVEKRVEKQKTENGKQIRKEKSIQKTLYLGALLASLCILMVTLVVISRISMKQYNSIEYQRNKAEKMRSLGEYEKAIQCYQRVMELGDNDVALLESIADMYFLQNDQTDYEIALWKILEHPQTTEEQLRTAYHKLIVLLTKKGDFEKISELLVKSNDQELIEDYKKYLAIEPEFDLPDGSYENMQSLRILAEGDGEIFYTTDGTMPGEDSKQYTLPIVLDYGDVTVKACLINKFGVKSKVITGTYHVERPHETMD